MSSHREAPEIASDPAADNTDVYAFVSPDAPDTVTLVANFIPGQDPAGGPNFYRFGDSVLYEIKISNSPGANADISFQFRFHTDIQSQTTFLYNTGPISSLTDPNWNVRQTYSVTKVVINPGKRRDDVIPERIGKQQNHRHDEAIDRHGFDHRESDEQRARDGGCRVGLLRKRAQRR